MGRFFLGCAVLATMEAILAPAQTFTVIYSFGGGSNGINPAVPLVQGFDGVFYGVAEGGGAALWYACCGTVFGVAHNGDITNLHDFVVTDGNGLMQTQSGFGGIIQATDGNLYGASAGGGNFNCLGGCGTLFKIAAGVFTSLHNFDETDGGGIGLLTEGADGRLYGAAGVGGGSSACFEGCGTLFAFTTGGEVTVLHTFTGTDGAQPTQLIQASDGDFYGTTVSGGAYGSGTVFRMSPAGNVTTTYNFGSTDGSSPFGGVVQAQDGNFYGTTFGGGLNNNGTVFRLTPDGQLTTLHSFDGNDGSWIYGGLVEGTDGKLYGTTTIGGEGQGTIYQITTAGEFQTVYTLTGNNGSLPMVALLQATNGNFYGTTTGPIQGGAGTTDGTVFRLDMGLAPFLKTMPRSGSTGSRVFILGTNMAGATNVTFGGISASFTIVTPTTIVASVPAGALSGKVAVTTPDGTQTSYAPFLVR
jgi:uncharacterized repeat protein (TIGR03803 family)